MRPHLARALTCGRDVDAKRACVRPDLRERAQKGAATAPGLEDGCGPDTFAPQDLAAGESELVRRVVGIAFATLTDRRCVGRLRRDLRLAEEVTGHRATSIARTDAPAAASGSSSATTRAPRRSPRRRRAARSPTRRSGSWSRLRYARNSFDPLACSM